MKTRRVRILVAIDEAGNFNAVGGCNPDGSMYSDDDCREYIFLENVKEPCSFVWLEAAVPVPQRPTIEAVVALVENEPSPTASVDS